MIFISKFSGKCDLYDCEVKICGSRCKEYWKNLELHVGSIWRVDNVIPINSPEDLVPYYPFIERCSISNDSVRKVWIGEKSYITESNIEMLEAYKDRLLKVYNRCKRRINNYKRDCKENEMIPLQEEIEKLSYNSDLAWEEVDSWNPKESIHELARRVGENGKNASIDDLSWSDSIDLFRSVWKDALIESGKSEDWANAWIKEH